MQFYTEQLDYNIIDVHDRMDLVSTLLEGDMELPGFVYAGNRKAQNVIEKMANYVLFAYKDDPIVKKEFKIETKHSSFKRKREESLDELLEKPTFDEHRVEPVKRNIYTKPKETIRDCDKEDIEEIRILLEEIELFELILKFNKEKDRFPLPPGVPELSNYKIYKWRHMIIQMRVIQYLLKDSYKPKTRSKAHLVPHTVLTTHYNTMAVEEEVGYVDGMPTINFGDKRHIYFLLKNYTKIVEHFDEILAADMKYIIWELDTYIDKAALTPARMDIVVRKIDGWDNERIAMDLQIKYGLAYNASYISTIWKHEICSKVASAAILSYKEWEHKSDGTAWKTCNSCGERMLKDHVNFGKKSSARDGYNPICKNCLKEKRKKL